MKIAFVVENFFWEKHFGVRNYFSTIKRIFGEVAQCDYITFVYEEGNVSWYKLNINERDLRTTQGIEWKKGNPIIEYENMYIDNSKEGVETQCYYRPIGNTLKSEVYDLVIISNPWLVENGLHIEAKKIIGIVYDFNPSLYTLSFKTNSYSFADQHRRGYEYYNTFCDRIICISKKVRDDYLGFYPQIDKNRVIYLEPFLPYEYKYIPADNRMTRERAIVLAAPFDKRKGLYELPEILNNVSNELETLYIFGYARCGKTDFVNFFSNLTTDRIVYYPYITYEELAQLYNRVKVLLFPSKDEGLGLPIIEAQYYGCRVMTTDKEPMSSLVLDGAVLMQDSFEDNCKKLRRLLEEEYNSKTIMEEAQVYSDYDKIVRQITDGLDI